MEKLLLDNRVTISDNWQDKIKSALGAKGLAYGDYNSLFPDYKGKSMHGDIVHRKGLPSQKMTKAQLNSLGSEGGNSLTGDLHGKVNRLRNITQHSITTNARNWWYKLAGYGVPAHMLSQILSLLGFRVIGKKYLNRRLVEGDYIGSVIALSILSSVYFTGGDTRPFLIIGSIGSIFGYISVLADTHA